MSSGAGSTVSAQYENEREVGRGLFPLHTPLEQNRCLRKTYCFPFSYLISSPGSSISKSSASSDVFC